MLVMRLGRKYRITLEPIQQHIENELFLRIHRDYEPELQQYDEGIRKDMAALMQKLEKQSRDYFNLLQQEGQEKDEEEAKDEANEEDRKAGSEVTADVEVEKGEQEK